MRGVPDKKVPPIVGSEATAWQATLRRINCKPSGPTRRRIDWAQKNGSNSVSASTERVQVVLADKPKESD